MRWTLCLLFIVLSQSVAQTTSEDILKLLVQTEQTLLNGIAVGDRALWNTYLHDECIIVVEDGSTRTKAQFIEELNPLPAGYIGRIEIIEPKITMQGQTAVVSFVDDEYLELYQQNIHTQYRQTDTWMNFNGSWKIVAMQLFEIPKNPPPIVIDSTILKRYVGTYGLSEDRTCEVYVEKGKLFVRKGTRPPQELFAQTEHVFFRQGDGRVDVIFQKRKDGLFVMTERREGEDVVWTRREKTH